MLRASCGRGTADWFGVSKDSDSTQKWQRKSIRHCSQRYGKLKPQVMRELDLPSQDNVSLTSTETPPPLYVGPCQLGMQKIIDPLARGRAFRVADDTADGLSTPHTPVTPGAASLCSFSSSRSGFSRLPRRRKRESVAKMSFRAAAALVKGRSLRDGTLRRVQRRSFTPASFLEEDTADFPDELDTSFFARVRAHGHPCDPAVCVSCPDRPCLLRKESSMRSCPRTRTRCSNPLRRLHSRTGRRPRSRLTSRVGPWTAVSSSAVT